MASNILSRLQKLRRNLADNALDGMFVSQEDNRHYLSGFLGTAGSLLITAREAVLATDFRYIEQAGIQAPDYRIVQISATSPDWFAKLTADLNIKRLGFEAGDITFSRHRQLSESILGTNSQLELVPTEGTVEAIRMVKEPEEIEFMSSAAGIADKAVEHARKVIHAGLKEKELAWEIEKFMRESGSQSLPFEVIVASGPNAALPHARPSERRIGNNEPVVIDIGARIHGYCSDLTRTICLEEPNGGDPKFKQVYAIVLKAQSAAITGITKGTTGRDADALARKIIEDAGYGKAFGHSLGHGVGLDEHEQPCLGPNSKDVLTDNMVFTVEPGIYLSGWGGIRIEDLVVLENGKIRPLSKVAK
ncbi:MAG: aminopeptidase P family protein [Dehalococcoidales bacterium]|nr:aminopeptidase P family protein [Dehalococcoidales bacterium]